MYTNHTTNKPKNVYVFHNGKTVKVGYVLGDTFYKVISGRLHIMRNFRAIFFEVSSLDEAERCGAKYVHITDSDNGKTYRAPIALIRTLAIRTPVCPGQMGLALNQFNRPDTPEPRNTPKPIQMDLFGGMK